MKSKPTRPAALLDHNVRIRKYLKRQEGGLCRFVQDLVRVPTVNPPGENYAECVALLDHQLKSLGMTTRVLRVPSELVEECLPGCSYHPRFNLIARWDVGAARTLHFNAHYDVVPVSGDWRFGPFEPKVHAGWLYGRGSADMKGPIAACCFAVKSLQACGLQPAMNLEISFTADEEVGGETGAGYMVRQGLVNADYAVVCEGASGADTGIGHNGVLWLQVGVLGKPAHASQPQKGINAFEKMAGLALELENLKTVLAKRSFQPPHGKVMRPTINQGGVFEVGPGAKVNTVPAYASFAIDRRINPGETLAAAEREVRAAIRAAGRKVRGLKTEVSTMMAIEPCLNDHTGPLPRAFAGAISAVRRGRPRYTVTSGFTDMHYFSVDGGIPTVGYGAGGEGMHGVDERVRVKDLLETAAVYAAMMTTEIGDQ